MVYIFVELILMMDAVMIGEVVFVDLFGLQLGWLLSCHCSRLLVEVFGCVLGLVYHSVAKTIFVPILSAYCVISMTTHCVILLIVHCVMT